MTVFALPDLGEGLQEAEIVTWHVIAGDHVVADQPLVSVETDKAVVEIPAPVSGTVVGLLGEEGTIVAVGAPLAEIDTGEKEDAGAIVGDLPSSASHDDLAGESLANDSPKAAPAVRRLARGRGIDLARVTGSGPGGVVLSRDVEAAARATPVGEPLRGVRRAMARAMERSREVVVPATVTDRAIIQDWPPGERATPRLVRAIVDACAVEPALNAWYDGTRRVLHNRVDLSIGVDTPDGLFSPVLRDAGNGDDIAGRIAALRERVTRRSITPEELRGGTITLSNFGTLGGRFAALVVSPPQVAILGAGRISEECVALGGKPAVRRVLPLSLTIDHRAVTGSEAARFLATVRASLERSSLEEKQP